MKKLIYRSGAVLATAAVIVAGAAGFSAYEAHIVNVTAKIENAMSVSVSALDFGNVFPQEKLDQTFNMSLSDAFLAQAGSGTNLIVNGGFEAPALPNGTWHVYSNADAGLTSWNVESGAGLEIQNHAAGTPHGGNQLAELDSNNSSSISQTVTTVAGGNYTLSFWYSPRPGRPAGDNTIGAKVKVVSNGTELVNAVIGSAAVGGSDTNWQLFTYNFTAADASTKVIFSDLGTSNSFGGYLDDVSLVKQGRVNTVTYQIRQKPKCARDAENQTGDPYAQVYDVTGATGTPTTFACPTGYHMMPLLCPYLSKHELANNCDPTAPKGANNACNGISAFHGDPANWNLDVVKDTQVNGTLSAPGATTTAWNIDLKTPCFKGQCAQDWASFVHAANPDADPTKYMLDKSAEHNQLGCDLWVEVNGITNGLPN